LTQQPTSWIHRRSSAILTFAGMALLGVLVAVLSSRPATADVFSTFSTVFLGIFIEAMPFLFLGTLASGLVEVFVDQDAIRRLAPRSPVLSALAGSLLGFFFPVCECGVVPLVRRLFRKGLPIPAGTAFLLAAPVVNPIVIFSTAAAFGFGTILLMRVGFTILVAFLVGLVFSVVSTPWEILKPTEWITADACDCHPDHDHDHDHHSGHPSRLTFGGKIRQVFQVSLDEFFEMGRFLVIGSMIAASLQAFIPQSSLLNVAQSPLTSVLVMMAMGIILSICSTVDSFVALGFAGIFSTGSILSFLVYGPMVDIKSILMFTRVFKPRVVVYMAVIPFMLVLLIGVSLNIFMGW
jgi:uncharacterized membrane protein YraQ (UPF0718 family)